jgi:hypothetical protein
MIKKILIVLLFTGVIYADSSFVGPSVYYTNGSYSDENTSRSFAFYNLLQVSRNLSFIQHYDNLLIKNPEWNFRQHSFLGGVIADFNPVIFKLNYGHYTGDYLDNYSTSQLSFNYSDMTEVISSDIIYYSNWSYLGLSYTFITTDGFAEKNVHQAVLRFDKLIAPELFVSIRPSASIIQNGITLFSTSLKLNYYASKYFIVRAGAVAGERTFYFDTDLLLFFNQNDIQKYAFTGQLEYIFSNNLALITAYSHNAFKSFEVNYFVAGIRTGFWF